MGGAVGTTAGATAAHRATKPGPCHSTVGLHYTLYNSKSGCTSGNALTVLYCIDEIERSCTVQWVIFEEEIFKQVPRISNN